jgi:hypothetical protein
VTSTVELAQIATYTADLHEAVSLLTEPRRVRLLRDTGSDWATIPSLWQQLADAMSHGGEQGGRSVPSSRLPFDVDVRDLRADIADTVVDALRSYELAARKDLPADLRQLAAHIASLADLDLAAWWQYRVKSWCRMASNALALDIKSQPRRIRDTDCPSCGASHVTLDGAEGPERHPALLIDFHDGMVRAAECGVCGQQWGRWMMNDLAEHLAMMRDATRPAATA